MNKIYIISVLKAFPKTQWKKISFADALKSVINSFIFHRSLKKALDTYVYFSKCYILNSQYSSRTIGFFLNKQDAVNAVLSNDTNMREDYYDYAVIEERQEGFSYLEIVVNQIFYKFDQKEQVFKEIDKTECEVFNILKDRKILTVFSLS